MGGLKFEYNDTLYSVLDDDEESLDNRFGWTVYHKCEISIFWPY